MSSEAMVAKASPRKDMWEQQLAAILWLELKKVLFGGRATMVYLLAAMPVALFILVAMFVGAKVDELPIIFGQIHQVLLIRMVVFFGCAWMFTNLFRGEILDRSLHYYFLVPVRRELIVAGKYLAGVLGASLIFGAMTILSQLAMYGGRSPQLILSQLLTASSMATQGKYLAMTVLACAGYGAIFTLSGLLFRNPFVPAVVFWGWESISPLMPATLKQLSIIHHVQALSPVQLKAGPFAILAEPNTPAVAVIGLLIVSAVVLGLSALRLRTLEVSYGAD